MQRQALSTRHRRLLRCEGVQALLALVDRPVVRSLLQGLRRRGRALLHWWRLASWLARVTAVGGCGLLLAPGLVLLLDRQVGRAGEERLIDPASLVSSDRVALVLGTVPQLADGRPNRFYHDRLAMAARLYHQGQVSGILVSGDNGRRGYDEPGWMRRDLIAAGVPEAHITCDFAGFRTLDSVVRARVVFGLEEVVLITQACHGPRALFLARHSGLDAWAVAVPDRGGAAGVRLRVREALARCLAVVDVALGIGPRFLGPPVAVARR